MAEMKAKKELIRMETDAEKARLAREAELFDEMQVRFIEAIERGEIEGDVVYRTPEESEAFERECEAAERRYYGS